MKIYMLTHADTYHHMGVAEMGGLQQYNFITLTFDFWVSRKIKICGNPFVAGFRDVHTNQLLH